jgi:hypothetical protein
VRSSGQFKAFSVAVPTEQEASTYLTEIRIKKVEAIKAFVKASVMSCNVSGVLAPTTLCFR